MQEVVTIKKYANRRLYDTEKSAYITLSDLTEMLRAGRQVKIIDAKTEEDQTAYILTQIVLEEAKNKNILLPAPLLHLIIRYGDNVMGDFFQNHLEGVFQNYLNHKQVLDGQFKNWLEMGIDLSQQAQQQLYEMNPFKSFYNPFHDNDKKQKPEE